MSDTKLCQAVGCTRVARHQWRIAGRDCFLCSECKLAVQHPWEQTPELEPEGGAEGGDDCRDATRGGAGLRAVPDVSEVDANGGPGEVPVRTVPPGSDPGDAPDSDTTRG
jgi:hypothetical protein